MRIDRIDLMPFGEGSGILVRVASASGMAGLGEVATDDASPAMSRATVAAWLERYGAGVLGAECGNFNVLERRLDAAEPAGAAGCPPARAALEMAALDLVGRARGCPLHEILGGGYREALELFRDIGADDPDPAGTARAAIRDGHAGIRLSVSGPGTAAIEAVLDTVGNVPFVDLVASQSFGNEQRASMLVEALLARQFHLNLALVQPLHHLDLAGHGRLRSKLPIPVVLEESITSLEAMAQVVRHAAADRIVLDVWRVGGLRNARRIANICESAAIGVVVAGPCRSAVGRAALGHLAATIHGSYPVWPAPHRGEVEAGLTGGPAFAGGRASLDRGPGLGVVLDEAWAAQAMRAGDLAA
ncbi:MAG: enolase C-terminal domain-like protein [Geminicoccaceae bacterium]